VCVCGCVCVCVKAEHTSNEAACNATCVAAVGGNRESGVCSYTVPNTNISWQMCGECRVLPAPGWWPPVAVPPAGQHPGYWPPGYALGDCSSCDSIDGDPVGECKLGCMFNNRPVIPPLNHPRPTYHPRPNHVPPSSHPRSFFVQIRFLSSFSAYDRGLPLGRLPVSRLIRTRLLNQHCHSMCEKCFLSDSQQR
jgi:hypothetical protein